MNSASNRRMSSTSTIVEVTVAAGEDDRHLLFNRHRRVLPLLQHFNPALAAIELLLRRLIQVGAELRERRKLAILRQFETQTCRPPTASP